MINVSGLTSAEAAKKLIQFGDNSLPSSKPRSFISIMIHTVSEPMFLLLLGCGTLYLALGDLGEAVVISAAILLVISITVIQERRTERTLDALRDLSSPRALVIRDGKQQRIAGKHVVPDDLILIQEGDRIPADGFVIENKSLKINESLITGESVSVSKTQWNTTDPFDDHSTSQSNPFVYSGTIVVQGSGIMLVHKTGSQTLMGRIGKSVSQTQRPPSLVQLDTRRIVKSVALVSLSLSVLISLVWWYRENHPLQAVLMGLTFALSTIPEEFPVVLTIFMAIGAWRMAQKKVLTRQIDAIETLGAATVLCVDKTGTLTENKMTLTFCWTPESTTRKDAFKLVPPFSTHDQNLIETSVFACDHSGTDPIDCALIDFSSRELREILRSAGSYKLKHAYPLERPLLAVGYLWENERGQSFVACKGAPESILELCSISAPTSNSILDKVREFACLGARVLAVARTKLMDPKIPAKSQIREYDFEFVGLIGFSDPIRDGVRESVQQCYEAGVKVIMITGDYPDTAAAIARQAGFVSESPVMSGDQIKKLDHQQLTKQLQTTRILARMIPEQKLRIVQSLQADGEVVAMTGDGVNDAPALKAANIGIAMGHRGTDVAREASALVLLDDNFTSVVAAIRLGRRIYQNIQKATSYIIAIHIPIIGLALIPVVFGIPPILWPVHLAFLELIIDPVCSIVFEAERESADVMRIPPRPIGQRLFNRSVIGTGVGEGIIALLAVMVVYFWIGRSGDHPDHARAVAFTALILVNMTIIFSLRAGSESVWSSLRRPNRPLFVIGVVLAIVSGLILYIPGLSLLFHFRAPHIMDIFLALFVACAVLSAFEFSKRFRRQLKQAL